MREPTLSIRGLLRAPLVRIGMFIWAIGCGPLIVVAIIGLLAGTNPNPIGLGIIAMFATPAGLFCNVLGLFIYFITGGDNKSSSDDRQ